MRRSNALIVLALVALVFTARSSAQNAGGGTFVTGQILVKFRLGAAASVQADVHRQNGGTPLTEIARTRVQLVAVPDGDERGAINRYLRNPNVELAEPNFIRTVGGPPAAPSVASAPGDFHFVEQYALHNTGQLFYCVIPGFCFYAGTPDADIDAPEAWALSTGSDVKVAVIDTGIDATHPDLAGKVAGGYDYVNGDTNPADDHSHGTHVAGTIAAALNNLTGEPAAAEGVVGVAPNARILAYKVCNASGSCTDFGIEQAIAQAVSDGARVINMSLGSPDYSRSLDDAVQDAWAAGLVVVAGAGNNGTTAAFYPAAFLNVISVGASDEDDARASFSNYGWVDIAAPGNTIMSTYPMDQCGGAGAAPGDIGCYGWKSGTSMASPHVAGAAAMVWSRSDVSTNGQVVEILQNSADAGVGSVPVTAWTNYGRLNLYNAMTLGSPPAPGPNNPPVANAGADQSWTDTDGDGSVMVTLNGTGSSDPDGDDLTYQWREGATIIASGPTPGVFLGVGVHTIALQVTDSRGASSAADTVVVTIQAGTVVPLAVNAISPNVVNSKVGTRDFVITGTSFSSGAAASFVNGQGQAPRVLSVTYNSSTQLTARVEIRSGGPKTTRRWDVVVTNPGGASAVGRQLLTITP
jgi:thermitase